MSEQDAAEYRPSAGTLLRQARESAGLHIGALSVALKVPVKKLEALEADRVDLLPDAVFARALASSMCRTLKIDAEPVLAALPQLALPTLGAQGGGINATFRTSAPGVKRPIWEQLSKPWVMAVLALMLGTFVMVLMPSIQQSAAGLGNAQRAAPAVAPATVAVDTLALRVEDVPTQVAIAVLKAASAPDAQATTDAGPASASPIANPTVAQTAQPAATQVLTTGVVQDGILMIKTRGPSWVEVTDASGTVQLRKTMVEGENLGVSGRLPMRVILGRAEMAEVHVRGQAFDLTAVSKDNVARFEVR